MNKTEQLLQICYEITMSIGKSMDINKMLQKAMLTYLRKLNCSAGVVYQLNPTDNNGFYAEKIFSAPLTLNVEEKLLQISHLLEELSPGNIREELDASLPQTIETSTGIFLHVLHLTNYGVLVLVKNNIPLDREVLLSLDEVNDKLAQACLACHNNDLLRQSETFRKRIYDSSRLPIVIMESQSFKFIDCNQAAVHAYRFNSKEEVIGKTPIHTSAPFQYDGKPSKVAVREHINRGLEDGSVVFEWLHQRPDGSTWDAEVHLISFESNNEKLLQFSLVDISERKQSEQELKIAKEKAEESDRLKSAFLANMSHEIRTPMNGILGFADLLKEPGLSGEKQMNYIDIIEKSGQRMLNIINNIIDISKIEAGLMKTKKMLDNINDQTEYIYTFFKPEAEAKGLTLHLKNTMPSSEAVLFTDKEKLYAVLANLVKNAIKYTDKGSIEIGYNKKGQFIEFYVKDTGIGVPINRQKAIFERFIQADINDKMIRQGAGLGLAITKAYIEMLGGEIWMESQEGSGSSFYFTLPYNVSETEIPAAQKSVLKVKESDKISGIKVLIAEDDEVSQSLLSITVDGFCSEKLLAKNGLEAVDLCRDNPDIDLILMDIRMPEMNGFEATQKIREFNNDVIIIAQTAYGFSGDKEKAIEMGCNGYISKPISKTKLKNLIDCYLKK